MHIAVSENAVDAAKVLIANGVEVNAKNRSDDTPLDEAIEKGMTPCNPYSANTVGGVTKIATNPRRLNRYNRANTATYPRHLQ